MMGLENSAPIAANRAYLPVSIAIPASIHHKTYTERTRLPPSGVRCRPEPLAYRSDRGIDIGITMRQRDEPGLELRGRNVHLIFNERVEKRGKLRRVRATRFVGVVHLRRSKKHC